MSSINVNIGSNVGRAGIPAQSSGSSSSAQVDSTQASGSNQVSYQNASPQTTMNLLTQRMMSNVATLNAMNIKELNILIRELLSMPKEIQQLLALLAFGETNPNNLSQLFKDPDLQLIIKQLQQLLGNNSKEVINKLIQLTQNNALFFEGSNQLRDILGVINKISASMQTSPSDALTTAMILYLPWLPLLEQNKFELIFGHKQDEETGEKLDIEVLILFIRTDHLGTFKITIILNKDKTLDINIESDKAALNIITNLTNKVNERLGTTGVKSNIATTVRKVEEKKSPKELKAESKKSVSLHPSGKISVITVNAGYLITKIIFAMDEREELLKVREEKIK
ncbi:MAG: hypothetical protein AB1782_10450 [Cyanobacteriota bacterium]